MSLSRRQWVTAAAGAVSASCSRKLRPWAPVSIHRASSYGDDLYNIVREILLQHRLDVAGKRVVLKPNLVEFDEGAAINTHPRLVYATLEAFRSLGAADVRIAEGPGHRRHTLDVAHAAGYFTDVPKFETQFTDLNLDEITHIKLSDPHSKLESLFLPNTVLGCDLLVSMPKLKTHHWAGATLSMKNLFGIVPGAVYGWPKNVLHWAGIDESIADLHKLFPTAFSIVDGITAMEGNGPIQGTSRQAGVIVAGADPPAVDATCCRIMSIDPAKIGYLQLVAGSGQFAEELIPQIGVPISHVAQRFQLLPSLEPLRSTSVQARP